MQRARRIQKMVVPMTGCDSSAACSLAAVAAVVAFMLGQAVDIFSGNEGEMSARNSGCW